MKKIRRNVLPESVKEDFRRKDLICCEYKDLTERQEREIFQRVQLGVPLTAAEAFRATQGSWQRFAQLYEEDFSNVINRKSRMRKYKHLQKLIACSMQERTSVRLSTHFDLLHTDIRMQASHSSQRSSQTQAVHQTIRTFLQKCDVGHDDQVSLALCFRFVQ